MTGSSESVEMYLKSVAELGGEWRPVSIGRVAERLGISPVSANEMMKRLSEQRFIHHEPYKGVTLTSSGQQLANNVIRRQRLWECFLVDHLRLDWARAHDLACSLEHATASEVTEALAGYLDNPAVCPHGNPIPGPEGEMAQPPSIPLAELAVGDSGRIQAISPENGEVLAYIQERGLVPGLLVKVIEAAPLRGPLTLQIGRDSVTLGLALAERVLVEKL
jgi:DtxR family transcriptional regulator, Mn-dependent transcriptional regulator